MAFSFTSLATLGGGATGGFPVSTSSVSLTSGVPVIIWLDVEYSAAAPTPVVTASTGETSDGGVITVVADGTRTGTQIWGASNEKVIFAWLFTPATTASRTFEFSTPSGTVISRRAGIVEFTGADTTTPVEQVQVAEVTAAALVTVTLPVTVVSTSGTMYIGAHRQTGTPTLGAGLTNLAQVTNSTGQAKLGYADAAIQAPEVTFSASGRGAAIAIEFAAPSAATDVIIPVALDVVVDAADVPAATTDPTAPVVSTPPTPVVVVGPLEEQAANARPNPMREMDLPRLLADMVRRDQWMQGQIVAGLGFVSEVDADPDDPQNGQVWVRSDTGELVWKTGGIVHRLAPPGGT